MKMSDRRLKRIMKENPVSVQPEKKEEMLLLAWMQDEAEQKRKDGLQMKYMKKHKIGALIAAVILLISMTGVISAGLIGYYYHTPGGNILNHECDFVDEPKGLSLKMTEKEIRGKGYTITEVNWTSVGGKSTFTVWVSADSVNLKGVTAKIGDTEYVLKKSHVTKTKDGKPLNYGYSSLDVPEPENFKAGIGPESSLKLQITEPEAWHYIFFVPEECEPVEDVYEDVTLYGYCYDDKIYYGFTDSLLINSDLNTLIDSIQNFSDNGTLVAADGTSYVQNEDFGKTKYGVGEGSSVEIYEEIPGITPQELHLERFLSTYHLMPVEGITYCELPIPEPGQALTGEWKIFDAAGITFTITKITREDEKTITFTTPDTQYLFLNEENRPKNVFSDAVSSITLSETLFMGDPENEFHSMKAYETKEGYYYRYSAKSFREYCKTHDTIPMGISYVTAQYSGDWILTFPEN